MIIRLLPEASVEIREAVRYYNSQRAGLGREFRAEVDATIDRIKAFPEGCQAVAGDYRRCRMNRFPYGIFYPPLPRWFNQ
ncbi:hypothetical protein BH23PLA1_BH23PLA1_25810 [soil metagenome]